MSRINGFVGRRDFLKLAGVGSLGMAFAVASCKPLLGKQQVAASPNAIADFNSANSNSVSAQQAIKRLLNGNRRFITQKRQYSDESLQRLRLVAKAQYPFAAILGCSDSRVPAEIVFDQGLGDLFVVRVAGNVVGDAVMGSLEYSTAILGSQLIVVLGHRRCGAVTAAINNEVLPGKIGFVVEEIKPAVERVKFTNGDISENAVIANIQYQVEQLQSQSRILTQLVRKGKLKILGALYDLDTGQVTIIT
ncbi:MAG: carbonic anhydrase [Heteroscytonema crispum UTEX LB 1556]